MILPKVALARSIELQFFDGAIKTTRSCPSFDLTAPRPSRLLHPAGFCLCAGANWSPERGGTGTITNEAVDDLALKAKAAVIVVVKASDVMIAVP
jgi:hypothetical protein